jgi:hypothetical protein
MQQAMPLLRIQQRIFVFPRFILARCDRTRGKAQRVRFDCSAQTLTRQTGRLGGVFQPPNRADILRLTYSKISEIGISTKACVGTDREVHLAIVDYDGIHVLDFPHIPYRNSADSFLLTRSKTSEIGISAEACLGKATS